MKILIGVQLLVASLFVLSACNTTKLTTGAYKATTAVPTISNKDHLEPIVVVRLVAAIDPASKDQIEQQYANRMILGSAGPSGFMSFNKTNDRPKDEAALQNALGKTAYYTLELYRHLRTSLPNVKVMLQPVRLEKDGQGNIVTRSSYDIPYSAITVNFFAHYDPNTTPLNFYEICTTFGNQICPLVSVTSPRILTDKTEGLVSATEMSLAAVIAGFEAEKFGEAHSDISMLINNHEKIQAEIPESYRGKIDDVRPLNVGKIATFSNGPFYTGEVGRKVFHGELSAAEAVYMFDASTEWMMRPYVNIVGDHLANIWNHESLNKVYSDYIALYDPELAKKINDGVPTDNKMRKKLKVIHKFSKVEVQAISKRSEGLIEKLEKSSWRGKVVDYLRLERKTSGKALADEGMKHVGAMVAGMGAAASATSDKSGVQALGGMAMVSGVAMSVSYGSTEGVMEDFGKFFSDAIDIQTKYVVDLVGITEEIEAGSITELRARLKKIYARRFKKNTAEKVN